MSHTRGGDDPIERGHVRRAAELLRKGVPHPLPGMDLRVLAAVARDGRARVRSARSGASRLVLALAAVVAVVVAVALGSGVGSEEARAVPIVPLTGECPARKPGGLVVAGVWAGPEAERFAEVLRRFERRTGIAVTYAYNTRNIAAAVQTSLRRGCPPDVAVLPQPGLVADLARRGSLRPLDRATQAVVRANYSAPWRRLATVDGQLYGVWFKAAYKSTFWYRDAALRAAGVMRPPGTWAELLEAARRIASTGVRPIALAGGSPWTLTDWFENLYLRSAGPRPYADLAAHRIPWTDPSVVRVLRQLATLFGDTTLVGPTSEALDRSFERSVAEVFGPRPRAAMVYEGDFVRSFLRGPAAFSEFPGGTVGAPSGAAVVGGDMAVLFDDGQRARALLRYLATPAAAEPWARAGGLLSPNRRLPAQAYPDALTRRLAAGLVRARTVQFDLSDLQPPAFGATAEQGMWAIFQAFLADPRRVEATARELEAAAEAAWACQRAVAGRC